MTVEIKKCVVICRKGHADVVILRTNLPSPVPAVTQEPCDFTIPLVQAGTGERYCKDNFPGVPVEVVRG